MENRLFARWHVPVTVKYTFPDGFSGEAHVDNISLGGVSFPLTQKSNIFSGTSSVLRIRMPESKRETVIFGEVIWLRKVDALKGVGYIVGIRFVKLDPLDMEQIITSLRTGLYFTSKI